MALPMASPRKPASVNLQYRPSLPWETYQPVTTPSEFPTIIDFLFKSLNRRFLDYYDVVLAALTTLEPDELDARMLVKDTHSGEIEQLLGAYSSYAPSYRSSLLTAMLAWRSQQQNKKTEWSEIFKDNTHPKVQGLSLPYSHALIGL
jgi:hypothetical protein